MSQITELIEELAKHIKEMDECHKGLPKADSNGKIYLEVVMGLLHKILKLAKIVGEHEDKILASMSNQPYKGE